MTIIPVPSHNDTMNYLLSKLIRRLTIPKVLMLLGIAVLATMLLLPSQSRSREAARRSQCRNNLKRIGIALRNYEADYGTLSPSYTIDAAGKPLHSWRTLLLPYLDQEEVYDRIDLSRPWNDPANADTLKTRMLCFACPTSINEWTQTTYFAIDNLDYSPLPEEPIPLSMREGDQSKHLLVIEVNGDRSVHWMSPDRLDENFIKELKSNLALPHAGGIHMLNIDGSVTFVDRKTVD